MGSIWVLMGGGQAVEMVINSFSENEHEVEAEYEDGYEN